MGKRIAAKITGVAGYTPPRVVTNADLEKIVDTNDEWIRSRTGIRERHYADAGMATSHMAVEAAQKVLASRNVSAEEIEMIIVATVTPDMFFPATACLVQDRLGAKKAWGFDLSGACSGFVDRGFAICGSGKPSQSAGDRQRHDDFGDGLYRSSHLRIVWRRRRGSVGGTGGV
jgi:3-oxoacyl-(acyl-carrier-protein) synthase III